MGQDLGKPQEDEMYRPGETLYLYVFENNIKKELSKDDKNYEFYVNRGELAFYDHSEREARKQFQRFFGFRPGKLLRREPW